MQRSLSSIFQRSQTSRPKFESQLWYTLLAPIIDRLGSVSSKTTLGIINRLVVLKAGC
jgi:hypothetical protein